MDEGQGTYVFSAKVSFDEVNERLHVEIEPEGFETVGGYVLTRVGRVPAAGETFEIDGLAVEVVEAERRRIHRVAACAGGLVETEALLIRWSRRVNNGCSRKHEDLRR